MIQRFVITKYWLNKHKTKNGGWTKQQVATLGLDWPLTKGWQKTVIGCAIDNVRKDQFEWFAEKPNDKQVKSVLTIDNCIAYLFKNANKLDINKIQSLRKVESEWVDINVIKIKK